MRVVWLLALLMTSGCQTDNTGALLTSEENGWFNVRSSKGTVGLYYCNAKDATVPKCYRASIYDDASIFDRNTRSTLFSK